MNKKINQSVLEHLRQLCYDVLLFEQINQQNREVAASIVRNFFHDENYEINWVKCNQENNPHEIVDMGRVKIEISEKEFPGSSKEIIHIILL